MGKKPALPVRPESGGTYRCAHCHNDFRSYRRARRFCSLTCYHAAQDAKMRAARPPLPCAHCGETVQIPTTAQARRGRAFCSPTCATAWHSGEKHPNWTGGRSLDSNGYVLVNVYGRGRIREHVLVAEATLGRRLLPGEQVHHRNGKKTDNRPENLAVMSIEDHGAAHALACFRCPRCGYRAADEAAPEPA